jgi:putative ABC transport system permease protein
MEGSMAPQRFSAELVGTFAVMALLLASVGIYGLLAYLVGQRSQEIGVRIALGAQRSHILRLILTQGALLAGVGVCVGLTLAALAAPMIAALLYGIRAIDPIVFSCGSSHFVSGFLRGQLYSRTPGSQGKSHGGLA